MPKKQRWAVRIILDRKITQDDSVMANPFIECLRYAGLVVVHKDNEYGMTIDLIQRDPKVDSQVWAQMNAKRMESFGFNAVAAPEYPVR